MGVERLLISLSLLCGTPCLAQQAFKPSEVRLTESWIEQREELNTQYLRQFDADRLLHNFRLNAGLPTSAQQLEGWEHPGCGLRGHFTGHYLSAISAIVEQTGDAELRNKLGYMVAELAKCQKALGEGQELKGYLSAFPMRDFDVIEQTADGAWAPYYTYHKIMQGLLDAAVKAGNRQALMVASEMANWSYGRIKRMTPDAIERMLYTIKANPSNEAGGMNDVLYQLYAVTRDPHHLELARTFDRDWFLRPLAEGRDILSGLHSNTHLPIVIGFARAYDINKDKRYRDAVVNFWDILMRSHVYVNGSSSGPRPNVTTPTSLTAEHWTTPGVLSTTLTREIAESCVSHNTQRLTALLFGWTGDAKYADAYMNTYYNAVLALHNSHTGQVTYHLPLGSPRHKHWLNSDTDFRCCNGSSIEAFTALGNNIYFHRGSELWVNLYVPSALDWQEQGVKLTQSGDMLRDGSVTLTVCAAKPQQLALNLLSPSWSKRTVVQVNGKEVKTAKGGTFCTLKRKWNDGDRITVRFDLAPHFTPMPDDPDMVALQYGPMLLAFCSDQELHLHATAEELARSLRMTDTKALTFELKDGTDTYRLRPLFDVTDEPYSVYIRTRKL